MEAHTLEEPQVKICTRISPSCTWNIQLLPEQLVQHVET